ncbi:TRAP transporter substrate-binding protein [Actibacterium lipolyticum]|uniref:2,3-diketo-L-gulonate-binding periplasmic protein YiaO n=1 Tax=Actibacterium lipolyticum TaxID=1524263 RepID=A0A238JLV9_9RHOB|nr:TRAP transporter substrate-binding protein DctP [Actibacterium lipolyticum]SMX31403.1 2,3-diketo-L-gulonate-binding periplasmic protein YiaO precursor [Actibacterium lipolyticum]
MKFKTTLTALSLLGAFATSANAEGKEMLLGTMAVPGTTVETASHLFAEKVAAEMPGQLTVIVNDSLLKGAQLAPSVRDGVVDAVVAVHPYLSGSEPVMGLQNLPGVIRTAEEYQEVLAAFWREDLRSLWNDNWNSHVVAEGAWATHNLFTAKPVETPEDFAGLKIRVHNAETARFISQLGALPTPLDASEMAAGLERGVIDGLFTPSCYAYKQELFRSASHIGNWQIGPIQGWAILINNDKWNALSADEQAALTAAGEAVEAEMWANFAANTAECVDGMIADGATYFEASDGDMSAIFTDANTQPVVDDWKSRMADKGFDGDKTLDQAMKAAAGE